MSPFEKVFSVVKELEDDEYIVEAMVRFSTFAEAYEAIRLFDSGENFFTIDKSSLTPRLEDSHEEEKAEKGWSRWEILCAGFNESLASELGESLEKIFINGVSSDKIAEIAHSINYASHLDLLMGEKGSFMTTKESYVWLAEHIESVKDILTPDGRFPMFRVIGEAIEAFGEYAHHGYPGVYDIVHEENLSEEETLKAMNIVQQQWKNDCRTYGKMLQTGDSEHISEALVWLSEWFCDLWD